MNSPMVAQMIQTALIGVNVISGPEVTQMMHAFGLPQLRTRALTDAMGAAGFGRIDRPRIAAIAKSDYRGRRHDARNWNVPGLGACSVYVRDSAGHGAMTHVRAYGQRIPIRGHAALVFDWIAQRRIGIPDKRVTRFEANPGKRTLARAVERETEFIRRRSEGVPLPVVARARVTRGEVCAVCGARPPVVQRTVCHDCIIAWRRIHDYPKQRSRVLGFADRKAGATWDVPPVPGIDIEGS
jgi:hypothetical protein